jgi:hypothetical protein
VTPGTASVSAATAIDASPGALFTLVRTEGLRQGATRCRRPATGTAAAGHPGRLLPHGAVATESPSGCTCYLPLGPHQDIDRFHPGDYRTYGASTDSWLTTLGGAG